MARCLLLEANVQKSMWTYAVMAAAYIRNRCFNVRLGKTPYEAFTGSKTQFKQYACLWFCLLGICTKRQEIRP